MAYARFWAQIFFIQLMVFHGICETIHVEYAQPLLLRTEWRQSATDSVCRGNATSTDIVETRNQQQMHDLWRLRGGGPDVRQEQPSCVTSFLRWLFNPDKRQKLLRNPGSGVMVQAFDWELLSDRGRVYWEVQQEVRLFSLYISNLSYGANDPGCCVTR